ncbi:MAG: hypothetical protein ABR915_14390 [Thermoguttaceae bacterium]
MQRFIPLLLTPLLLAPLTLRAADPPAGAPASANWLEDFEGPNPSWSEAGGDTPYVVQQHRRVSGVAHHGQGCEWFQLSAGQGGGAIYIAHDIGRPWVIEDLRPSVWIKSDRPGVQLVLEVVLPRTVNPRTGRPAVTHLLGSAYTDVGRWQQLSIGTLPQLLARQLRILASQLAIQVDGGEAYVGRVLLNTYGGPGINNVWIDELAAAGHVASGRAVAAPDAAAPADSQGYPRPAPMTDAPAGRAPAASEVQLAGSALLVRGQPMLPRAIQYQGEPLALLKQLGFNTVWLREVPSAGLLAEAARVGLWLVCPPPVQSPPAIGPEFQPVLAWDLGSGLTTEQAARSRRWAEEIRLADARAHRPLVGCPANDFREYSRHIDVLVIDRRPLGTSLEMPDYGLWVRRLPLVARPGTPVWTTIQTQPGEGLRRQLLSLAPQWPPPTVFAPEQIRLLVSTAISCGSRGLVFQSQSPLSATDPQTRQRAMTLALLNLELDVIEPWVAAGSLGPIAESNQKQVAGAVLRSDRARLVLPVWLAPRSQCVAAEATANPLALVVPAVPESSSAYDLTAGRLEPLRRKRETGGTRVTLDEFHLTAAVLLAQDPLVVDAVNRRVAANARPSAEFERQLAAMKLDSVGRLVESLGRRLPPTIRVGDALAAARRDLDQADARLRAGDFPSASLCARRAMRPLRKLERDSWDAAMTGFASPVISPGTATFATLPWHWNLVDRLRDCQPGPNRLLGGEFEDFDFMLRTGWRLERHGVPGVQAAADPVAEARHSGRSGLRLTARADNPENPPVMIETPPVWVTTPAVPVEAGQIVWIHGWVNVPSPITGSVDGLMVIDSLAGEDLADRIDKTAGWREFSLLRAVERSGPMTVTFVLTGLGEVWLDDVAIQALTPGRS